MNNELQIKAFQHLSFEVMKDGKRIPKISSEVCVGETCETILEGALPLEEALDNLIGYKTRGFNNALTSEDREILLSEIDSILTVVQAKITKIKALPEFKNSPTIQFKSKKKP